MISGYRIAQATASSVPLSCSFDELADLDGKTVFDEGDLSARDQNAGRHRPSRSMRLAL